MITQYPRGEVFRPGPDPCDLVLDLPFYNEVPKELGANLEYRLSVLERAAKDPALQQDLLEMCRLDPLFWISTFCWLLEPRGAKKIPFIPWQHQADIAATIYHYLISPPEAQRDIGLEKSRGEGASWTVLMLFLHQWMFSEGRCSFGLVSRNQDAVDNAEDDSSLMPKLDFQLEILPPWMTWFYKPKRDRRKEGHTLRNQYTGSKIVGYAATEDVARGGRATAFMFDEMAAFPSGSDTDALSSLQHVTEMRVFVSTPKGTDNEYHRLMHDPSNMLKVISSWQDNPARNRGLYRVVRDEIEVIDPVNNPLHDEYVQDWDVIRKDLKEKGFEIEETVRSPWFDRECFKPGATPQSIAQELERNYGGAEYQFFRAAIPVARKMVRQPYLVGHISYNEDDYIGEWVPDPTGSLVLWMRLNGSSPPVDRYAVAWDLGGGTGGDFTSNSVMTIVSLTRRVQVGRWSSNRVLPQDCARLAVATCRWLESAKGSWVILSCESNNQGGQQFATTVMDQLKYWKIWHRRQRVVESLKKKVLQKPFHHVTHREALLSPLRDAIIKRNFEIQDFALAEELGQFVYRNGKVVHSASAASAIESGAAHGDHVMSAAIAWDLCVHYPPPKPDGSGEEKPVEIPKNSPMGRFLERERDREAEGSYSNW